MREDEKGWTAQLVKCDLCSHQWMAVYPIKLQFDKLECSNCGNLAHYHIVETLEPTKTK